MSATRLALAAVVGALVPLASCADPSTPHPHTGMLKKYEPLPPTKMGLPKVDVADEELRQGEPMLRHINLPGGWKRMVSFQDVEAPEKVVWSAINDLPNYHKYVQGVVSCDVYSSQKGRSGEVVTCATYVLKAAGFAMTYYMQHNFYPKKHCMTFHLHYDRCSDLSDSVGYWYVEDLGDGWCRVYYSTDTKLPRFIPGFAKDMLTTLAAKRSTGWVEKRCNQVTGKSGGAVSGRRIPGRQLAAVLALAVGWWVRTHA